MGIYDTVGDNFAQVKLFKNSSIHYPIGSKINILDGLYITYDGWFVIKNGTVLTEGISIYDKYGNNVNSEVQKILDNNNDISKIINTIKSKNE